MPRTIKPSKLRISPVSIPTPEERIDERLSFSFNFLVNTSKKFNYASKNKKYFVKLLERLKNYGGMTAGDLKVDRTSSTRCHPIEWEDTTETCFGIPNEDEICQEKYQLTISSNEHGRIHGFFIYNVFYVVWLDPDHRLYNG